MSSAEQWITIESFPDYQISNLGRVKSFKYNTPRIISSCNFGSYKGLYLRKDGRKHVQYIHQLVASAFIGPANGLDVRHLDGNRANNCLTNLAYGTRKENMDDARQHDTIARGSSLPQSKLTDSKVIKLRELRKEGITVPALAKQFNISLRTVYRALTGESWSHIK